MPRNTRPARPSGHSRAHIRHQQERVEARRLRRLRDEGLLKSRLRPRRARWGSGPMSQPPLVQELKREGKLKTDLYRVSYNRSGRIPASLSHRLLYGPSGCASDYYDCACKLCAGGGGESRRAREKQELVRLIEEQLREVDPQPKHPPRARPRLYPYPLRKPFWQHALELALQDHYSELNIKRRLWGDRLALLDWQSGWGRQGSPELSELLRLLAERDSEQAEEREQENHDQ